MSGVSSALAAIVVFLIGWGLCSGRVALIFMQDDLRPSLYSGKTAPKQNKAEIEQLQPYAGQSNEKSCRLERA